MIEGRPRESLVDYENPIEVSYNYSNFIDLRRSRYGRPIQEIIW